MQVQPYLFFDGRCDEALEFYKKAIDAKVEMLMRFKDAPDQSMISPGSHDKVMHAAVRVGDTQVLVSDGRCLGKPNFQGFALTITAPDAAEGERPDRQPEGRVEFGFRSLDFGCGCHGGSRVRGDGTRRLAAKTLFKNNIGVYVLRGTVCTSMAAPTCTGGTVRPGRPPPTRPTMPRPTASPSR